MDACQREEAVDRSREELSDERVTGRQVCGRYRAASLEDVRFVEARMALSDFRDAELESVTFADASLNHADFRGARLQGVRFENANLHHANFAEAELTNLEFVNTTCPDGTDSERAGGSCEGHGMSG